MDWFLSIFNIIICILTIFHFNR